MFIDTHCHLNMMVEKKVDEALQQHHIDQIGSIISQAHAVGVYKIVNVGTSLAETHNSIMIAQHFPSVFASAGIHPCDTHELWRKDFKDIEKLVAYKERYNIVAIGETGLDYYHQPYNKQRQKDAFKAHIELALAHDLPLVVHVREAADDVLEILSEYAPDAHGVNHCFCHEKYVADQFISWGWFLGIDGPITYKKNEAFRRLVATLPLEHLILETDAPFLPPQHYRGKKNSPSYIPLFAQTIADLHEISLEELGRITSHNAQQLFAL